MKYLKKYNEELHLNPLQFGKAKVDLIGGTTIYVTRNARLTEDNKKDILTDLLKAINRDLGGGWIFEKYDDNLPPDWKNKDKLIFTKGKNTIQIIMSNMIGGLGDLTQFDYIYLYKLNLQDLLSQPIMEKMASRKKVIPKLESYVDIKNYLEENHLFINSKYKDYLLVDNNSSSGCYIFNKKFRDFPAINLDIKYLKVLVKKYQEEIIEQEEEKNKRTKNIEYIKSIYPKLIEEIKDVTSDIKDFTSFSEEIYTEDPFDNLYKPIMQLNLHWEKLKKDVVLKADDINDWDYLIELGKHIKQIDARVRYLSDEYLEGTGYLLEVKVDPRNYWSIEINLKEINSKNKRDDYDYDQINQEYSN